MKKHFGAVREYHYKGYYIYQITRRDYCVFGDNGCIIDELTLKAAKARIDKLAK